MKYPFHQEVSIQPSHDIIFLRLREKMGSSHITWHKGTHSVRSPRKEMILQPQNHEIFWGWGGQAALPRAHLHESQSHGELPLCFWSPWWPSWQFSLCFRHVTWKPWQMTRVPLLPCTTDITQVSRVSITPPIDLQLCKGKCTYQSMACQKGGKQCSLHYSAPLMGQTSFMVLQSGNSALCLYCPRHD